jgi:hypothetical protein
MSNLTYYLLWLMAGLLVIAMISAAITQHLNRRVMRRIKGVELLDALARYCDWVSGQRRTLFFEALVQEDAGALQEIRALRDEWFPDLAQEVAVLVAAHEKFVAFLRAQRQQRLQDAEAWLEADHDAAFNGLWRNHLLAAQALAAKLELAVQTAQPLRTDTTSPA